MSSSAVLLALSSSNCTNSDVSATRPTQKRQPSFFIQPRTGCLSRSDGSVKKARTLIFARKLSEAINKHQWKALYELVEKILDVDLLNRSPPSLILEEWDLFESDLSGEEGDPNQMDF